MKLFRQFKIITWSWASGANFGRWYWSGEIDDLNLYIGIGAGVFALVDVLVNWADGDYMNKEK